MFEFHWTLAGATGEHEVRLQIRARDGWIGRKLLYLDGQPLFRRRWFAGINHRFHHPDDSGRVVELRATRDPASRIWYPRLTCGGEVLHETTGSPPPSVPDRPPVVAIVTGVTYLVMLATAVMCPHIWKMLETCRGRSDTRAFVMVVESTTPVGGRRLQREDPPPGVLGQPYDAFVSAEDGTPPYRWKRVEGRMPAGLSLNESTGRISGTPRQAGETTIGLQVTDSQGSQAHWAYMVSVAAEEAAGPRITTETLPPGRENEEYSAFLEAAGGRPPYRWLVNERKLPSGLKVSSPSGDRSGELAVSGRAGSNLEGKVREIDQASRSITLNGNVVPVTEETSLWAKGERVEFEAVRVGDTVGVSGVGDRAFPVLFKVYDSTYSPYEGIAPWFVPFGATSLCLLGFWNMRLWSVVLYGALILLQAVIPWTWGDYPLPTSALALALQGAIFLVGAVNFTKMR